ncbi:MAG: MOSC domain-containing protein [Microscillaceae bacterium]|nr:MOSC domain-containing protein [Microscillaceae bacterium]
MANLSENSPLSVLMQNLPQVGRVEWIGLRPAREAELVEVAQVAVTVEEGLVGDHFASRYDTKRQVTLIQAEHLEAVASMLHRPGVSPQLTRRNIVVRGINLLALKDKAFWIGDVKLEMTGLCHPCSRMESNLGPGGYNAMRGHGGITARVLQGGLLQLGDAVQMDMATL